jgi:hypothetical protein
MRCYLSGFSFRKLASVGKDILFCDFWRSVCKRKIGSALGISRNTVNIYMKLFTASDYSFIELLCFDNAALSELFSSHTTVDVERQNELMLYFEGVNKARNQPGFTFLYHYQQYL